MHGLGAPSPDLTAYYQNKGNFVSLIIKLLDL
jgi:hypothetical protein